MTDKTEKQKQTEKWQQEWLELVHNGACCADVDPQKDEKKAFLKSLKEGQQDKPSQKKID